MEKESYETYEYLPASGSNAETEPYQFFVVQDDGTFLINRQVQYVTQVQDVKEALEGDQHCTMLDVGPQQFFVDIDTTTEMIVSDQLNISEGTSNLYASSYLLQPGVTAPVEQIQDNVIEQPKPNVPAENNLPDPNKQVNSLTEITLTDEQYQMLEQKGWILLETNDKVYVLDTLGLHDITTNDKLIQKLKLEETSATNLKLEAGQLKIEFSPSLSDMDVDIPKVYEHDELKLPTSPKPAFTENVVFIDNENKEQDINKQTQWDDKNALTNPDAHALQATQVNNLDNDIRDIWKYENVLRIRTDFHLKDIPDKIVLGKTKNGKRLVCRAIRPDKKTVKPMKKTEGNIDPGPTGEIVQKNILTGLDEAEDDKLDAIFRKSFKDGTANYSADDVTFAGKIIKELLRLPAVKPSIVNRNMLITKVSVKEIESKTIESLPTLVTGTVQLLNEEWRFFFKPELYVIAKKELSLEPREVAFDHNFLHMHVHEIEQNSKVVRTAITLSKRRLVVLGTRNPEKIFIPNLPLNVTPEPPVANAQLDNLMYGYACGTCAAIFRSQKEFDIHRVTHQTDEEDKPIVNTEQPIFNKNSILVLADPYHKGKTYSCMQCNAKFQRLNNCQRHVKSHILPGDTCFKEAYKCKICQSVFHHAPTLFKHIMKSHIRVEK